MAYYRLEPFGEERDDLRMARMAAVIANVIIAVWTGEEGNIDERDLLLRFDEDGEDDSPDVVAKIERYFSALASAQR